MIESKLFAKLPEYVTTPDGMAIDSEGNLILACPNYADTDTVGAPGCVLKIDKNKKKIKVNLIPPLKDIIATIQVFFF